MKIVSKKKSARYSKNKGRAFQNLVKNRLQDLYPELSKEIKSAIMGEAGIDIKLSTEAKKEIPFDIECKAVEKLNIQTAYEQACNNSVKENPEGSRIPVVVHKRNRKEPLITLGFETFLGMVALINSIKKSIEKNNKDD